MPNEEAIRLATIDEEIARCHSVMAQLRPHVPLDGFVARIRRMEREGYRLAYRAVGGEAIAVAGFRIMEQLHAGRVLYVDDLVTDAAARSGGHGAALLDWLHDHARQNDCDYVELDSGVQRNAAHRFYFARRFTILGYHFRSESLRPPTAT